MSKFIKIGTIVIASLLALPSYSQESTQAFATCLADSLNGKERKELAKWIFLSISVHPTLKEYSKASANDSEVVDQYIGKLVTRLLTENCPAEMRAAHDADPMAIQKGFEFVGQVAMQEIMSNEEALKALTGYAQYIDQEKLTATLSGK